jgi:hypothetical protein
MAIVQISQIQVRRGLEQDLPQLAGGEFGWSQDTRRLYIGNGTLQEGAPVLGHTEILTEFSVLNFTNGTNSAIANLSLLVSNVESNVTAITSSIPTPVSKFLPISSTGTVDNFSSNASVFSYTLSQGTSFRSGTIRSSFNGITSTVSYEEDYTETGPTDVVFNLTANTTQVDINYTTISPTTILYTITNLV